MSADLLAEFGEPGPSCGGGGSKVVELNRKPVPDSTKVLIADIPDITNEAASACGSESGTTQALWHKDQKGADVLFDVSTDTYNIDDEFGDFEHGEQATAEVQHSDILDRATYGQAPLNPAQQSPSLLDSDRPVGSLQPMEGSESRSHEDEWGDFSTPATFPDQPPRQQGFCMPTKVTDHGQALSKIRTADDQAWESFEDDGMVKSLVDSDHDLFLTSPPSFDTATRSKGHPAGMFSLPSGTLVPAEDETRPTNIPPPAILFQILPETFEQLAGIDDVEQPSRVSNAVLQAHTVATYLIAGRALRWKRDYILSQSTKFGPASSGRRGGGMKLAAVDKSENIKEEREIGDVIKAWDRYGHLFRSMLTKAGIRRPLITLCAQLRARPVKGAGVLPSMYACALCGLRRDERVAESDTNVDDSFGEFWVEHWGHLDCKDFWQQSKALLPQR